MTWSLDINFKGKQQKVSRTLHKMPLMTIVIFRGLSLPASFSRLCDKKLVQALCFSKNGKLSLLQRQVVMTTYANLRISLRFERNGRGDFHRWFTRNYFKSRRETKSVHRKWPQLKTVSRSCCFFFPFFSLLSSFLCRKKVLSYSSRKWSFSPHRMRVSYFS